MNKGETYDFSLIASFVNSDITKEFVYDDFKWQYDNKVSVKYKNRAKGLHKVLYHCPNCNTEYMMNSEGTQIFCTNCNKRWQMTEYGRLEALDGKTEFSHAIKHVEVVGRALQNTAENLRQTVRSENATDRREENGL